MMASFYIPIKQDPSKNPENLQLFSSCSSCFGLFFNINHRHYNNFVSLTGENQEKHWREIAEFQEGTKADVCMKETNINIIQ